MVTSDGRVRYSETDATGRLSMTGLLRLFQDLNYLAVEDVGRGIGYQTAHRAAWYLLSWDVRLDAPPALSDPYRFEAAFYRRSGSLAKKYMTLTDKAGDVLATADTRWAFVDTVTGEPLPCPPDYFGDDPLTDAPRATGSGVRIRLPDDAEHLAPLTVGDALIDENGHANNVRLTELAMALAGFDTGCRRLRAEFLRQTRPGDCLTPVLATVGTDATNRRGHEAGTVNAEAVNSTETVLGLLSGDGKPQAVFAFSRNT